jgi:hypothetical protein
MLITKDIMHEFRQLNEVNHAQLFSGSCLPLSAPGNDPVRIPSQRFPLWKGSPRTQNKDLNA